MGCNQGCKKTTGCTCSCNNEVQEACNECVNQASIAFAGICDDPTGFTLDVNYWKEFDVIGTIAVPMEKPSIEEVDSINSNVQIISKRLITTPDSTQTNYEGKKSTGKKLVIEGLLCMSVSYVSLTPEQSVHSFHGQIPFSVFIVMPADIDKDYDYYINSCIEDICVKRICERTIEIRACITLKATPFIGGCSDELVNNSGFGCSGDVGFSRCKESDCFTDNPVITGVCPEKVITELLNDNPDDQRWTEISVPEVLTIPDSKPDILQILTVVSRVEIICQQIIATPETVAPNYEGLSLTGFKLLVHGLLKQRITYTSNTECKSVHSAHYDVPICVYIVLPDVTDFTDKFRIKTCIEDIYACALNNRQIFKNTTLFIKAEEIECE